MSLLKLDTTRKRRVDNNATKLDAGDDDGGEYKVEAIFDSAVYAKKSELSYPEEENTWKPDSAVQHFRKLISSFHKNHPDKPIATSEAIDTAPPMARPTIRPTAPKQKRG